MYECSTCNKFLVKISANFNENNSTATDYKTALVGQ